MKKLLSVILSVVMLVTTGCFATGTDDEWKNNTGTINLTDKTATGSGAAFDGNTVKITKGGDFTVTGTLTDGMIYVNTGDKVKLRLSGVNISNSSGSAIFFDGCEKSFITITEGTENYISDGSDYTGDADAALYSNSDLEIKGSGKLTVNGNYKHGIASKDDISIENGEITVTANEHGIKSNNKFSMSGGTVDITTKTGKGIKAKDSVTIDGGNININAVDEGIESKGTMVINDGNISVYAKDDGLNTGNENNDDNNGGQQTPPSGERPEMPQGGGRPDMAQGGEPPEMPPGGNRPDMAQDGEPPEMPQDGKGQDMPQGGDFDTVDAETATAHSITINGGKIYINADGDGIDSNGDLTINGGEIVIDGPTSNGDGSLDASGTMTISGGTVIALSSAGMIETPRGDDNQNYVKVIFSETQKADSVLSVKNSDGDTVMTVSPKKSYQALIFSSAELKKDSEYGIYINDELYENFTVSGTETTVGNSQGFGGGFRGGNRGNGGRQNGISVVLNGNRVNFDGQSPIMKNDTTCVPLRRIFEALGATVDWDETTQTVTAVKDDTVITLQVGNKTAEKNGEKFWLTAEPELVGGSTMVPVRFIAESFDMNVAWDEARQQVNITN